MNAVTVTILCCAGWLVISIIAVGLMIYGLRYKFVADEE